MENKNWEKEIDKPLYEKAKELVIKTGYCRASLLQRRFKIGYAKAVYLIDLLEENEVVGLDMYPRGRKVLKKIEKERKKGSWGCTYCNILNYKEARYCMNCGKKKKIGNPFSLHF